jgi:ABC-type transport system involved in multi-copper enzyme maturation permease subunit
MVGRVLAIAGNTYRENIRDKILYNLILFALIMILSSLALGKLTLGNEDKVLLDLGLSSISIFGMLIAIFIGIGLVYKELEKRTVYALLAKPVHRYEWILGKYLGLLFTLFVNLAIMTVGLALAMMYTGGIGHFNKDLVSFGELTESAAIKWICKLLYYVIPNLSNFQIMDSRSILQRADYFQRIDPIVFVPASLYCLVYCTILVSLAVSIFMRRDFK